ncbi:hypothetical protein ACTHO5_25005 [Cytobacillus praedii]
MSMRQVQTFSRIKTFCSKILWHGGTALWLISPFPLSLFAKAGYPITAFDLNEESIEYQKDKEYPGEVTWIYLRNLQYY